MNKKEVFKKFLRNILSIIMVGLYLRNVTSFSEAMELRNVIGLICYSIALIAFFKADEKFYAKMRNQE